MDPDRPPHRTPSTSDLFICFTSMKISSKSILSPGRTSNRDSLTTSLSRRLRTNRSIKGTASPAMFPATGKKRSGGFENQEPSSPKVTCIGQVRIKSKKKQGKRLRSLSRRRSTGDSFRKLDRSRSRYGSCSSFGSNHEPEQRNSQRWVHLPLTICEALRAFGSEFSCLFPCRSSCFSPATDREKVEKRSGSGSCVEVFTRWMVAYDGDGDGRRDMELVVGNESECGSEDGNENESVRVSRRHVFDDLEIVNDRILGGKDEARVSICIPPKNALLLMRCRSDPLKMEALANRLWQSTVSQDELEDEEFGQEFVVDDDSDIEQNSSTITESTANGKAHMEQSGHSEQSIQENERIPEITNEKEEESEDTFFGSLFDEPLDQEIKDKESKLTETETEGSETTEGLPECLLLMMYEPKLSMEVSKETWVSSKDFIRRQSSRKKPPPPPQQPPVKPTGGESNVSATATATATNTSTTTTSTSTLSSSSKHVIVPGRSSCSLPAPSSMAEMLEQKLVNAVGYEPFVLTRCKSEPMRTAAAKLAPDNCFWKNRKLEPLRRASFGVGAAGIGF